MASERVVGAWRGGSIQRSDLKVASTAGGGAEVLELKRSTKRTWLAVLCVLLVAAGCGGKDQPTGGDAAKGSGVVNVASVGGSYGAALNAAFLQPFENETG